MGGCWSPYHLSKEILSSVEQEVLIAAKGISRWRVEPNAAMHASLEKEVVMLKSHIGRGLSLPPSYFLKGTLFHYKLQLHHIHPNSFTIIMEFVALCEGYLGISPAETCYSCISTSARTRNQMENFAIAAPYLSPLQQENIPVHQAT
jgi:hypothetical protein